jgi:hypothetical protein
MEFNATFNNISVISWRSVLLVQDPKKTTDLSQVTGKLYHIEITLVLLPINNSQATVDEKYNPHMTKYKIYLGGID